MALTLSDLHWIFAFKLIGAVGFLSSARSIFLFFSFAFNLLEKKVCFPSPFVVFVPTTIAGSKQ